MARSGDVYKVASLADAGPGSLREGIISAHGPRTIVLDKSFITIAGQTAPDDGITLRDYTFQIRNAHDVVVRYLQLRLGDENKPVGTKGGDGMPDAWELQHSLNPRIAADGAAVSANGYTHLENYLNSLVK
ncbi:MAG: hypothetical protein EXS37_13600 [Opitutus sp.]|nr:hypothetical protein [Opitutus sp.]